MTAVEAAIPPEIAALNQQQANKAQDARPAARGSSAMKTQLRFSISLEIPLIAVLCLVRPAAVPCCASDFSLNELSIAQQALP